MLGMRIPTEGHPGVDPRAGRLQALDGLRGLSALTIAIIFHYRHFYAYGAQPDPSWFTNPVMHPLVDQGALAVNLFFVMSGVIFTHVYYEAVASQQISGRRFFMLRFARLYPLHLVTTVAMVFLTWGGLRATGRLPLADLGASDGYHLMLNLLMLQHIGLQFGHSFNFVSWSLSIEAICYCLFFWVARRGLPFELACFALATFGIYLMFGHVNALALSPETGQGLFGFFAGCLIARGFDTGLSVPITIAAAVLTAFSAATFVWGGRAVMPGSADPYFTVLVVILPSIVVLALTVAPLRWLLSGWVGRKLGDLSFSIYMVHISVQCAIIISASLLGVGLPYDRWWFYAIYVAGVLGVAEFSYRTIERPAQRWIRTKYGRGIRPGRSSGQVPI
ncbi:MAG: hypothetical protein QOD93_677 [Acetobacteraceae bacterium]|nr:hypothetical protein [Acetobacteraceae bacterium]